MKIKMLTGLAGENFSLLPGEIVDAASIGGDEIAKAWIDCGQAVEAPSEAVAASEITRLNALVESTHAECEGVKKELIKATGRLEAAEGRARGAIAEQKVHEEARAKAEDDLARLRAEVDAVNVRANRAEAQAKASDAAAELARENAERYEGATSAALAELADMTAERGTYKAQAEELGAQLAALTPAAEPAPAEKTGKKGA